MKRLLAASLLAIAPVQAVSDDTTACVAAWTEISEFADTFAQIIPADRIAAEQDGWCKIATDDLALLNTRVAEASFRLDQLPEAPPEARSLQLALTGLQTPMGVFDGTAALSVQSQTGTMRVHHLRLFADDGRGLRAKAELAAAFIGIKSDALTQPSDPGPNVVSVDFVVTPEALSDTRIDFSDVTRVGVDNALRDVSATQVGGTSRREFLRFVGATPNARGTLSVDVQMSSEADVFQFVAPFAALGSSPTDDDIARAFETALADIRLDVAWKPGRM